MDSSGTEAGHIVVHNSGSGLWDPGEGWTIEEVVRIEGGKEEGEITFFGPGISSRLDPQGRIVALDYRGHEVFFFSGSSDSLLYSVGGFGEGPGELYNPVSIGWDGSGNTWIAEIQNRRYSVFDSDGGFLRTHPREVRSTLRVPQPMIELTDGSLIDLNSDGVGPLFISIDSAGHPIDTMAAVVFAKSPSAFDGMFVRPGQTALRDLGRSFIPRSRWAMAPDGTVWYTTSTERVLYQGRMRNDTLLEVHFDHRSTALTADDEDRVAKGLAEAGLREASMQLVRPVTRQLWVLHDGHVVVAPVDEPGQPSVELDVYDPTGAYLGVIDLPFPLHYGDLASFRGDTLIAVDRDWLDRPSVVRLEIRR